MRGWPPLPSSWLLIRALIASISFAEAKADGAVMTEASAAPASIPLTRAYFMPRMCFSLQPRRHARPCILRNGLPVTEFYSFPVRTLSKILQWCAPAMRSDVCIKGRRLEMPLTATDRCLIETMTGRAWVYKPRQAAVSGRELTPRRAAGGTIPPSAQPFSPHSGTL